MRAQTILLIIGCLFQTLNVNQVYRPWHPLKFSVINDMLSVVE